MNCAGNSNIRRRLWNKH